MKTAETIGWLAGCAVRGEVADAERVAGVDVERTLRMAARHQMDGAVAMALWDAGVRGDAVARAKGEAIRRAVLLDVDAQRIMEALEGAGIWYAPLKGTVLKDRYPALGMRQMADVDILFDAARAEDVRHLMEGLGFSAESIGLGCHDVYYRPPITNAEMHRRLFSATKHARLARYYSAERVEELLAGGGTVDAVRGTADCAGAADCTDTADCAGTADCADTAGVVNAAEGIALGHGRRFTANDHYIYLVAHDYVHFMGGGTGLRSLMDRYLCWWSLDLDRTYIEAELEKLGILRFDLMMQELAFDLLSGRELSEEERGLLGYLLSSGAYGVIKNRVNNRVEAFGGGLRGKMLYAAERLLPPREMIVEYHPAFGRYPILLPLFPLWHTLWCVPAKWPQVRSELRVLLHRK